MFNSRYNGKQVNMEQQKKKQKLGTSGKQVNYKQLTLTTVCSSYNNRPRTEDRNECPDQLRRVVDHSTDRPLSEYNQVLAAADFMKTQKNHSSDSENIFNQLNVSPPRKNWVSIDNVHRESCDEAYNDLLCQLENSPPKKHCNRDAVEPSGCSNSFFGIDRRDSKRLKLSRIAPRTKNMRVPTNADDSFRAVGCVKYTCVKNAAENRRCKDERCDIDYSDANEKILRLNDDELVRRVVDAKSSQPVLTRDSFPAESQKLYESVFDKLVSPTDGSRNLDSLAVVETEQEEFAGTSLADIETLYNLIDHDWQTKLTEINKLNLNEWKRCQVVRVEHSNFDLILHLREYSKMHRICASTSCVVKGYWGDFPLKPNDIISIKAACYDASAGRWCIDDDAGYIVKHPDLLITGTSIVGSLFCQRQAILGHLFPGVEAKNSSMLVGSLVHELLQEILRNKIYSEDGMKRVVANIVSSTKTLFLAYQFDVSLNKLEIELKNFIPVIVEFVNTYLLDSDGRYKTWSGKILEVSSIEENFWVPALGIKGKTDFVVKAEINGEIRILPLELKTGRATNSTEHRGQIVLYSMMMSELGIETHSGLLLYLRHNTLSEINPKYAERRGLVSVRNNLVDWYVANERFDLSAGANLFIPKLPEPINHHSGCAKCPYLTVCSAAALSEKERVSLAENNPLNALIPASTSHLSPSHIRFVFHWVGLLKLDETEKRNESSIDISDVWYIDAAIRQTRGFCIDKLKVVDVRNSGAKYIHSLKRCSTDAFYDLTKSSLVEGDYIVVSSESRIAIALGFVRDISECSICLEIDRRLEATENSIYILDKYSVSESLLGFNISCLLLLLENTDCAARLRHFIIDGQLPSYSIVNKVASDDDQVGLFLSSSKLNSFQKEAILKTLAADDFHLIKGMPGTGKTAVIVALIQLLVGLKYSVLVTSQTHSAVDNILLRLTNSVEILRLGSVTRVHADLRSRCEETLIAQHSIRTTDELDRFYNESPVVGVTCMGCCHSLIKKRMFDVCIVDEATQVLLPSVIRSLYSSRKFVLVGDPNQLPPVVQGKQASRLGLNESLFKKLDRSEVTSTLCLQYRMNVEIAKLANLFAYDNLLQCDCEAINSATINVRPCPQMINRYPWLEPVLSADLCRSVVFLNTSRLKMPNATDEYSNTLEADVVFLIIPSLIRRDYDIGVIAPFREQVKLLKKTAIEKNYDIEINTVDQYQGRDKDVIIYSCTKHSNHKEGGILADKRRLTVAITRAKRKLVIVGNTSVLKTYSVFQELLNIIPEQNTVDIESL